MLPMIRGGGAAWPLNPEEGGRGRKLRAGNTVKRRNPALVVSQTPEEAQPGSNSRENM